VRITQQAKSNSVGHSAVSVDQFGVCVQVALLRARNEGGVLDVWLHGVAIPNPERAAPFAWLTRIGCGQNLPETLPENFFTNCATFCRERCLTK
jgi:hypothetical protein